jgi:hypothetical protein
MGLETQEELDELVTETTGFEDLWTVDELW